MTRNLIFAFISMSFLIVGTTEGQHNQPEENIKLIVRADDIGSTHAANVACIKSYKEGIVRSVEIMVPCPWFLESAHLLRENPGLDVGVHLTLTSEWDLYKWGPITHAPTLVDSNGYFFPRQKDWQNPNAKNAFWNAGPDLGEVETELRAQIEMALDHIPQVSHLSCHMGFNSLDTSLQVLVETLAVDYNLHIDLRELGVRHLTMKSDYASLQDAFISALEDLQPGIWLFVEHPGLNTPEMSAIGHEGNSDVAIERNDVTRLFSSEQAKNIIEKRRIQLIGYADLLQESTE